MSHQYKVHWSLKLIRSDSERANCQYLILDSQIFNNLVDSLGMEEVTSGHNVYTWFGPRKNKSKLDRALINKHWLDTGQWCTQYNRRRNSDQKPIVIKLIKKNWGHISFKLFDWWF